LAKKKARTPPPPRRVQAPKQRSGKQAGGIDQRKGWMMLYGMAISGLLILGAILLAVFVFHVGRHSTPSVHKFQLAKGCKQKTYKLLPGTHVATLTSRVVWDSFPPTSGPHYYTPALWNFYTDPINPRITLHNLEHGGIDIFYGSKVPSSQVQEIQTLWQDSPNAMIVAPIPKPDKNTIVPRPLPDYSHKIVLAAWTAATYSPSSRTSAGHGYMLTCDHFDKSTFTHFRDEHRGKGPERYPVSSLTVGS
jgi:hypothetical protein